MIIMIIKYLIAVAILHLLLTGCSSHKDVLHEHLPPEIHVSEQKKINNNQYKNAIKKLKALDNRYRFGPYSQQVKLDLIYWHYKSRDFRLAKASIDRFLRLNPTHPNVDYVLYMRGLTNMSLDENDIQSFFGIDRLNHNPEHARVAFCDFSQLIREYPNSQYAMDTARRLMFLKNRLARYELSVVEYYSKRSAYVAVANRVEQMLRNFSDTQSTRQALPYMEKAYRELQLIGQAEKVAKIISTNDKYRMH